MVWGRSISNTLQTVTPEFIKKPLLDNKVALSLAKRGILPNSLYDNHPNKKSGESYVMNAKGEVVYRPKYRIRQVFGLDPKSQQKLGEFKNRKLIKELEDKFGKNSSIVSEIKAMSGKSKYDKDLKEMREHLKAGNMDQVLKKYEEVVSRKDYKPSGDHVSAKEKKQSKKDSSFTQRQLTKGFKATRGFLGQKGAEKGKRGEAAKEALKKSGKSALGLGGSKSDKLGSALKLAVDKKYGKNSDMMKQLEKMAKSGDHSRTLKDMNSLIKDGKESQAWQLFSAQNRRRSGDALQQDSNKGALLRDVRRASNKLDNDIIFKNIEALAGTDYKEDSRVLQEMERLMSSDFSDKYSSELRGIREEFAKGNTTGALDKVGELLTSDSYKADTQGGFANKMKTKIMGSSDKAMMSEIESLKGSIDSEWFQRDMGDEVSTRQEVQEAKENLLKGDDTEKAKEIKFGKEGEEKPVAIKHKNLQEALQERRDKIDKETKDDD